MPIHDGMVGGQWPGEHIGGGDPPSANDAVDIANVKRMVATNKRTITFIGFLLSG